MKKEILIEGIKESELLSICYEIFRPAGNDTALVEGIYEEKEVRRRINDAIMKASPDVEQVAFYDIRNLSEPTLMMAGGELCGNAIRSLMYLVYLISNGSVKEARIKIKMENKDIYVQAGVSGFQEVWTEMPIKQEKLSDRNLESEEVVELDGITHVVCKGSEITSPLKEKAFAILQQKGLDQSVPAAGVMFLKEEETRRLLSPVVWVRDIKTLFLETACSTGTTAAVIVETRKTQQSTTVDIIQPSGMIIRGSSTVENGFITKVQISGPVKRITNQIQMKA